MSRAPLLTSRLELRRTRMDDAPAMFEALRDPDMYRYIPRPAPRSIADVSARFARITRETAPDRAEHWLNWTLWLRETGEGVGMVEATLYPDRRAEIGYMIAPRFRRQGYAREALEAMLGELAAKGAGPFSAMIDARNHASKALAARLGFAHVATNDGDEHWRRNA